ncbi:MAG: pyrroline-5-carboxylate reductase [Alphaproteobacteria bacterium]|nr:pyrroline-5-carboxylate reductase [Alphaproteobacteria bacterium]
MTKILLVGCGKMGGAMVRGWRKDETLDIVIVCPSPKEQSAHVTWIDALDKLDPAFMPDVVVLAIKPQQMAAVLPAYARHADRLFLSIAAGKTLSHLAQLIGSPHAAILRAMPNLPSQIGKGITVVTANTAVTSQQKQLGQSLLESIGLVEWIDEEILMDAVTALSGSGPAYAFALCEAMAAAGEKLGLAPELAATLARQTIIGSGALLGKSCASTAELRVAVTSPGGTTAAALLPLMDQENGLFPLLEKAMQAAYARAKELSS